jgi:hypothetical protein
VIAQAGLPFRVLRLNVPGNRTQYLRSENRKQRLALASNRFQCCWWWENVKSHTDGFEYAISHANYISWGHFRMQILPLTIFTSVGMKQVQSLKRDGRYHVALGPKNPVWERMGQGLAELDTCYIIEEDVQVHLATGG